MKAIDLFAGCGGMTQGFQDAGHEVVAGFDHWKPALEIYAANFNHPIYDLDLADAVAAKTLMQFEADAIIGGPPCQDFSISGKRHQGERANLTVQFGRLVAQVRPSWVVFENVYNVTRFESLSRMKTVLSEAGYGLSETVLDASYFGAPQARKRYFLVGKLGERDGFFDEKLLEGRDEVPMTVRDYLGDRLQTDFYYMHPRSYKRRAVFSIDEPAATIRGINRPIPKNYVAHRGDAARIEDGVRALTTRERALIQTFPDHFKLPGAKTNVELAIGNAVPPKLAFHLASRISEYGLPS